MTTANAVGGAPPVPRPASPALSPGAGVAENPAVEHATQQPAARTVGATDAAPAAPSAPAVSATEADWSREALVRGRWEPGKRLLRCIRRYQKWAGRRGPLAKLMCKWHALRWKFWGAVAGAEVPLLTQIGGGLLLPHPTGVVIHERAKLGVNCLIFQGVTMGEGGKLPGAPTLGGHVDVGAGAKLLGGIKVGDHARIGANAVVLCDVPAGRTAVGIPARII